MELRRTVVASALSLSCVLGTLGALAGCNSSGGSDKSDQGAASPAPSKPSGAPASAAEQGPYVALGDSYTSGPKIPDQNGTPSGCDRSDANYPSLVAKTLDLTGSRFKDVSCASATTKNLTSAQHPSGQTNPPQLDALSDATRLVTLGIGGNDVGFSSLLTTCIKDGVQFQFSGDATASGSGSPSNPDGPAPCRDSFTKGGKDELGQRITKAADALASALADIRKRAPQARVYVVGYPALLSRSDPAACVNTLGITAADAAYLDSEEELFNAELRTQAQAAGDVFVDTYTPSLGHDACEPEDKRWIEPLFPASPAEALHPNERGMSGMADAVLATIEQDKKNKS